MLKKLSSLSTKGKFAGLLLIAAVLYGIFAANVDPAPTRRKLGLEAQNPTVITQQIYTFEQIPALKKEIADKVANILLRDSLIQTLNEVSKIPASAPPGGPNSEIFAPFRAWQRVHTFFAGYRVEHTLEDVQVVRFWVMQTKGILLDRTKWITNSAPEDSDPVRYYRLVEKQE